MCKTHKDRAFETLDESLDEIEKGPSTSLHLLHSRKRPHKLISYGVLSRLTRATLAFFSLCGKESCEHFSSVRVNTESYDIVRTAVERVVLDYCKRDRTSSSRNQGNDFFEQHQRELLTALDERNIHYTTDAIEVPKYMQFLCAQTELSDLTPTQFRASLRRILSDTPGYRGSDLDLQLRELLQKRIDQLGRKRWPFQLSKTTWKRHQGSEFHDKYDGKIEQGLLQISSLLPSVQIVSKGRSVIHETAAVAEGVGNAFQWSENEFTNRTERSFHGDSPTSFMNQRHVLLRQQGERPYRSDDAFFQVGTTSGTSEDHQLADYGINLVYGTQQTLSLTNSRRRTEEFVKSSGVECEAISRTHRTFGHIRNQAGPQDPRVPQSRMAKHVHVQHRQQVAPGIQSRGAKNPSEQRAKPSEFSENRFEFDVSPRDIQENSLPRGNFKSSHYMPESTKSGMQADELSSVLHDPQGMRSVYLDVSNNHQQERAPPATMNDFQANMPYWGIPGHMNADTGSLMFAPDWRMSPDGQQRDYHAANFEQGNIEKTENQQQGAWPAEFDTTQHSFSHEHRICEDDKTVSDRRTEKKQVRNLSESGVVDDPPLVFDSASDWAIVEEVDDRHDQSNDAYV